MRNKYTDSINSIPNSVISSIQMNKPNQKIVIYSGEFSLALNERPVALIGDIFLAWFPTIRVRFKGRVIDSRNCREFFFDDPFSRTKLVINNQPIGTCEISKMSILDEVDIEGYLDEKTIIGDSSIPVEKIRFVVPNLRKFIGGTTKHSTRSKTKLINNRIVLEDAKYRIILDYLPNFDELDEQLSAEGGYCFLYNGEITKKRTSINHSDIGELINCLSTFLSFLNGRRCSPYCLQGIFEDNVQWTDFTPLQVSLFRYVISWHPSVITENLTDLWKTFTNLWRNEHDRDFLKSAIHWYLEANYNSAYLEGSIIMTQVGLELAYNWYVIEKNKLIIGKDAETISASNKIRILLSQVNVKPIIPDSFSALKDYVQINKVPDGIEALVQIRNALVHSQEEKRRQLLVIDHDVKFEALQLGLHYLEISILTGLNFKGEYTNRCTNQTEILEP